MNTTNIFKLLEATSNEERVAGVILASRALELVGDDKKFEILLIKVVKRVESSFIINMLCTPHETIHDAGLWIMTHACQYKRAAVLFKDDLESLISLYFKENVDDSLNLNVKSEILLIIKFLAVVSKRTTITVVKQLLTSSETKRAYAPLEVLLTVVDLVQSSHSRNEPLQLSSEEQAGLRSLVVQNLHGSRSDGERDRTLGCCLQLLKCGETLSPTWTIGSATKASGDSEGNTSLSGSKITITTDFPTFLCSVLRGELHLLLEEILAMAAFEDEESKDSMLQSPSACSKEKEKAVAVYDNNNNGRDEAEVAAMGTAAAMAENIDDNYNCNDKEAIEKQRQLDQLSARRERGLISFNICLSLMDSFLQLLVGDGLRDDYPGPGTEDEVNVDDVAVWATLSSICMMSLQQAIQHNLKELLEFLTDALTLQKQKAVKVSAEGQRGPGTGTSGESEEMNSDHKLGLFSRDQFQRLINRLLCTICAYAMEDAAILNKIMSLLPSLLATSLVPEYLLSTKKQSGRQQEHHSQPGLVNHIWNSITNSASENDELASELYRADIDQVTDEGSAGKFSVRKFMWPTLLTSSAPASAVTASAKSDLRATGYEKQGFDGEALLFLTPCLLRALDDATAQTEANDFAKTAATARTAAQAAAADNDMSMSDGRGGGRGAAVKSAVDERALESSIIPPSELIMDSCGQIIPRLVNILLVIDAKCSEYTPIFSASFSDLTGGNKALFLSHELTMGIHLGICAANTLHRIFAQNLSNVEQLLKVGGSYLLVDVFHVDIALLTNCRDVCASSSNNAQNLLGTMRNCSKKTNYKANDASEMCEALSHFHRAAKEVETVVGVLVDATN